MVDDSTVPGADARSDGRGRGPSAGTLGVVISTSTHVEAVAVVDERGCVDHLSVPWRRGASRRTLALFAELIGRNGGPQAIGWVAADVGPGSFTGVRLGLAVARTFAALDDLPTYPLGALDAMLVPRADASVEGTWAVALPSRARHCYLAVVQAGDGVISADADRFCGVSAAAREVPMSALPALIADARAPLRLVAPQRLLDFWVESRADVDAQPPWQLDSCEGPDLDALVGLALAARAGGHVRELAPQYAGVSEAERGLRTPLSDDTLPVRAG